MYIICAQLKWILILYEGKMSYFLVLLVYYSVSMNGYIFGPQDG